MSKMTGQTGENMKLGELLLEDNYISNSQLKAVLTIQENIGGLTGEILMDNSCISKNILDFYLSKQKELQQQVL